MNKEKIGFKNNVATILSVLSLVLIPLYVWSLFDWRNDNVALLGEVAANVIVGGGLLGGLFVSIPQLYTLRYKYKNRG